MGTCTYWVGKRVEGGQSPGCDGQSLDWPSAPVEKPVENCRNLNDICGIPLDFPPEINRAARRACGGVRM